MTRLILSASKDILLLHWACQITNFTVTCQHLERLTTDYFSRCNLTTCLHALTFFRPRVAATHYQALSRYRRPTDLAYELPLGSTIYL